MEDEVDGVFKASKVFFLDTNLSSPVLTTEISATKNLIDASILYGTDKKKFYETISRGLQNEVRFFIKLCKGRGWDKTTLRGAGPLLPNDYSRMEESMKQEEASSDNFYDEAKELCKELEEALESGLRARGLPIEEIHGTAESLGTTEATALRLIYEGFCNLFGRAESRVKRSECTWTYQQIGGVGYWINSKCAIIKIEEKMYYSSLNQVLMLKDKVATRFMLIEHVDPLGLNSELKTHLTSLFSWQDRVLTAYGNDAYTILKAVEPMFKTRLSHIVDNVFGDDTAYSRMKSKMSDKERSVRVKTGTYSFDFIKELTVLVESVTDIRSIVEMFGCQKSCGHPIIDPILGGLSAAHEAMSDDKTSLLDAQNLRNTFCHIILVSFIRQHGNWPRLTHRSRSTALFQLHEQQNRNIDYNSYPLSDWNTVEWTKILDFDYFPNFLDLMDDKSISLYRSDKHLSWEINGKPTSERRLLLEVLNRKDIDIKALVERVSRRDIPYDWFIVSLYPKEREFKLDPRMFAMLVMEMRCFFTAIEANIADGLFRYMPQQTMTKTKTQNQERFLAFTDPSRSTGDYTLFLEIDLTRWNLKWRQLVIHMLGHDLNMMFGTPGTFTVTHWFFSLCQIVVRVGGLRPEGIDLRNPPNSSLAWTGHLGGFEGLNQKLWTAATYAMVEMALVPLLKAGVITSYEIVGQGDNQVIRVAIPTHGESRETVIPRTRDQVNEALETTCSSVNQEVKPEENIESTSVLTYSKDVFVSGVEYPTSLKKHSRLFPVTSLDFPSVTNNARAILAGAVAGAENALYPLRSAIVGWYHTIRYIRSATRGFCIHGSEFPKLSQSEILAAVVLPPSIGGLAGLAVASFFYKGGSDPLGKEISGLRFLAEGRNRVSQLSSQALRALEERYCVDPTPDLTTLIDNPYGLPLARAASPLSKVGKLTLEAFKSKVFNRDIEPLLSKTVTQSEMALKKDLTGIRPLNPLLIHDLFDASGFGTVKMMRKMFVHTRTIQGVAQWVNPDITHIFLRADMNDVKTFRQWFLGLPVRGYSGRSSFDLVTLFRSYWQVTLHGVTNYQPLDFFHLTNTTRSPESIKWSAHSNSDLLSTRGPLSGYVGTATREKRSEHGYKIVDTGAPSRSVTKLQLIRSQAYGNKDFNELLDRIALTRSPVRLSDITDYLEKVIGGSIGHRYASVLRMMSASYVGPLNFVTHIRIDTNSIGVVSGSALNFSIMLQEFIIMAQAAAKLNYLHKNAQSGEMIIDTSVMTPFPDDSLSCSAPTFTNASLPRSVLLYSPTLLLARTYDNVAQSIPRGSIVASDTYEDIQVIRQALVAFFTSTLRDQNRAKVIADMRGHVAIPSRYQLDIAEAHALGPLIILDSIAEAITLGTIHDTYRTLQLHPERWDESLFLNFSIEVCVKSCSSYWNHPLFSTHKAFDRLRASTLRYGTSVGRYPRQQAYVRRQISKIMTTYDHSFWTKSISVFAGENQTQIVEALSTSAARSVVRLKMIGDPSYQLYSSLLFNYLRLPKNVSMSSPSALDLIRTRFVGLSKAIMKAGDITLGEEMHNLSQVRGILVFNDDVRTVLRYARSLEPNVITPKVKALKAKISGFITPLSHCSLCIPDPRSIHANIWTRNKQRVNGGLATAGYTWLPLIVEMELCPTVLIVGNGHGGLADLLISCYNVEVIGLDLEADMPVDLATLLNYIPVGIQMHNKKSFIQSDWSINSSGDWTDREVRDKVLNDLPSLSTLIIDATGPDPSELKESVLTSMDHAKVRNIYVRLIGSTEDVLLSITQISDRYQIRMWVVSRSYSEIEAIVMISRGRQKVHSCSHSPSLIELTITEEMQSVIPERRGELLEAATLNSISWEGEDLYAAARVMENLCTSLLNKPKSLQLKYKVRYGIMIGYATLMAACSSDSLSTIQSWIAEEEIDTDHFTYLMNGRTTTHLLRYVSRLSTLRTTSFLFFS